MDSTKTSDVLPVDKDSGLFARQATGLVRNITGRQSIALNLMGGMPALGVAEGIFFGLAGFPGGSLLLALLITVPFCLAFAYAFGLQSEILPRSGGDYMIVSRVLTPSLGFISTSLMMLAQLLAIASLAFLTVTLALAPALATVGLVAGSNTLVDWGNTVATSKGWQFAIGAGTILLVGTIVSLGWHYARRFIMWALGFGLAGLVVAMIIAVFTSHSDFISSFNSFAQPFTGQADSYNAVITEGAKAGVNLNASFSLSESIAMVGVIASFAFYSWNTAFVAGEIREGSTNRTGHRMAAGGVLALAVVALASLIFIHTWGHDFLTAAFGGGFPEALGPSPAYFFLTSAQVDNVPFAIVMCASFLVVFPVVFGTILVVMPRVIFAWAFDGAFPKAATKVNSHNAPVTATWIMIFAAIAALAWAVFIASNLLQVLVYVTLIQMGAMALVGVSAIALPYRRPELYRGSAAARKVLGIPLMTIAGIGAVIGAGLIYYLYFKYAYYGLADKGAFFLWLGGAIVVGLVFYQTAKWVRSREGIDLRLVYTEIPPE